MFNYIIEDNLFYLLIGLDYTCVIFFFGFIGVLINRNNLLLCLLCLELMSLASVLNFLFIGHFTCNLFGICYGIICLMLTILDSSIGLSLIVIKYRNTKSINFNSLTILRG